MAKIGILSVGKLKTEYLSAAYRDYAKRIGRYAVFEDRELKEEPLPKNPSRAEMDAAKQKEGERLLAEAVRYDAYYCLDSTGERVDSEGFADRIARGFGAGTSSIAFLVGGSNGLSDAVKKSASGIIAFSPMTFPHHLFRVMLAEQIYRAMTIIRGEKYHK